MSHPDPEVLALIALGQDTTEAPGAGDHVAGCADCQWEVDQFARVVTVARHGDGPAPLSPPPPELWNRIAAAAGLETGRDMAGLSGAGLVPDDLPGAGHRSATPRTAGPLAPWWRRRPLVVGLAAAVAGLIIGAGGAVGLHQLTRPAALRVVASIPLRPLPQFPQWRGAHGTATMATGPGGRQLMVRLRAPRRPGFYEVWLLARDGVSMISLGDLDAGHSGRFTMPPGVDLRNYSRIDISLQSFNGSTRHARTSVVRGSLP